MKVVGGRYELVRTLAGGGMGAVHEAIDRTIGRRLAIKTLHPHLAGEVELCERFRREAFAAAALAHPHIAQVSDYGVDATHGPFLALELLVGESLADRVARDGAMPIAQAVFVTDQILDALGAAHRAGIVHRDIKPGNLFLTRLAGVADVVKVIDFGIAKLYESRAWQRLTATGQVIGTPTYMAPEQALGRPIDHRVDLYALGLVLYAMLVGRPAFQPGGPEVLLPILEGRFAPIGALAPHVPAPLVAVVMRAVAVDREARFASAAEMRKALGPWLSSEVHALHAARAPGALEAGRAIPVAVSRSHLPTGLSTARGAPVREEAPAISVPLSPLPHRTTSRRAPRIAWLFGGTVLGAVVFVATFAALSERPLEPVPTAVERSLGDSEVISPDASAEPMASGREESGSEALVVDERLALRGSQESEGILLGAPVADLPTRHESARLRARPHEPGRARCSDPCRVAPGGDYGSASPADGDRDTLPPSVQGRLVDESSCELTFGSIQGPFEPSRVRHAITDRSPTRCVAEHPGAADLHLRTNDAGYVVGAGLAVGPAPVTRCLDAALRGASFGKPIATDIVVRVFVRCREQAAEKRT